MLISLCRNSIYLLDFLQFFVFCEVKVQHQKAFIVKFVNDKSPWLTSFYSKHLTNIVSIREVFHVKLARS